VASASVGWDGQSNVLMPSRGCNRVHPTKVWQVPMPTRQMSRIPLTVHIVLAFIVSRHGRQICTFGVHSRRPAIQALTVLCEKVRRCVRTGA
jgi:hypothetical protein